MAKSHVEVAKSRAGGGLRPGPKLEMKLQVNTLVFFRVGCADTDFIRTAADGGAVIMFWVRHRDGDSPRKSVCRAARCWIQARQRLCNRSYPDGYSDDLGFRVQGLGFRVYIPALFRVQHYPRRSRVALHGFSLVAFPSSRAMQRDVCYAAVPRSAQRVQWNAGI